MGSPAPLDCPDRLAILRSYHLTELEREARFDRLARLAAHHCRTPLAVIALLEPGCIHLKALYDSRLIETDGRATDSGFCRVVVESGEPLVIEDTLATDRLGAVPGAGETPFRFYAGFPLRTAEGAVLGSLCVMDVEPRQLSEQEATFLEDLAAVTIDEFQLSRQLAETRRAQEATRQAKAEREAAIARLDSLIEQAPFGMALFDEHLRYTHVNHWLARWNGIAQEDHLGHTPAEVVGGTMDPRTTEMLRRAQSGEYLNGVKITPQASPFAAPQAELRATCFPVHVGSERPGVGAIVQDLTEWQEATRGLDRFFSLAEDLLCLTDAEGRFVRVGASWERRLGWTADELVGRRYLELVHPDDVVKTEAAADELARSGRQADFRNRYRTRDGDYRHLAWTSTLDGAYCYAIARDVTDEHRQAERLHASETAFRTLAENLPDFVGRWTPDLRMVYVASNTAVSLGLDLALTPTPSLSDLPFSPDVQRQAEAHLRTVFETGAATRFAFSVQEDGNTRHFEALSVPEFDAQGRVASVLSTSRDVTERKKHEAELVLAKEEAIEMARLKDAFLSNMSHEVRTPLTSILGYIELLREEAPGELTEYVNEIVLNGRRLRDTLTSVLDLAQLRAGTAQPQIQLMDLSLLVRDTLSLFRRQAERHGLTLDASTLPDALPLYSDAATISRILHNLIGNAIKFTPEGYVRVHIEMEDDAVTIAIEDTGIGISEGFLPRLFDDFQQESSGITRTHEGIGLGLPITRALVETLGGRITVQSQKHVGTTFHVTLPRSAEQTVCTLATAPSRPRVLVVEDNASTRHLIDLVLRNLTDTVIRADGESGLAAAFLGPFDVVLLDINLGPGPSGLDLLSALRSHEGCRNAHFIAMTAYALPGDRDKMLGDGFDTYLPKPFTRHELLAEIRAALEANAERKERRAV